MLPKVANHLLHHTARAAAVAQNQTGHTIRNVLQLQSSSTPSNASGNFGGWNGASNSHSGWNNRGTGSGGAKFHPGGRSYAGYTGAGRVVTQAESISLNDLGQSLNDDSDDGPTRLPRSVSPLKRRSTSTSARERSPRTLAAIRTARSQAKSSRPFAGHSNDDPSASTPAISAQATALLLHRVPGQEPVVRHNATVASSQTVSDYLDVQTPPTSPVSFPSDISHPKPDAPVPPLPTPPPEAVSDVSDADVEVFAAFNSAVEAQDISRVHALVKDIRERSTPPSATLYNVALSALRRIRASGESLRPIFDLYNEMLTRSVAPNFKTYVVLIDALTDRDKDVHATIRRLRSLHRWQETFGGEVSEAEQQQITKLSAESNFRSAMTLFQTACAFPQTKMPLHVYHSLLMSCANHANTDAAIHIFAHLERRKDILPSARTFELLISVYKAAGDWQSASDVFREFREASKVGRINTSYAVEELLVDGDQASALERHTRIRVWNAMLDTYIRGGQHTAAIGLLEQMLDTKAGNAFGVADVPPPSGTTFRSLIEAFCDTGEVGTAVAWLDRLLLQDSGPGPKLEPSTTPSRPHFTIWSTVLRALALEGRVDELMKVMASFERFAVQDDLLFLNDDRYVVVQALFKYIASNNDLPEDKLTPVVNCLLDIVAHRGTSTLDFRVNSDRGRRALGDALAHLLVKRGHFGHALRVASVHVDYHTTGVSATEDADELVSASNVSRRLKHFHDNFVIPFVRQLYESASENLTLSDAITAGHLFRQLAWTIPADSYIRCLNAFTRARENDAAQLANLTTADWEFVLYAHGFVENSREGSIAAALEGMAGAGAKFSDLEKHHRIRIFSRLREEHGEHYAVDIMRRYDEKADAVLEDVKKVDNMVQVPVESQGSDHSNIVVDELLSKQVGRFWPPSNTGPSVLDAYALFDGARQQNVYPAPIVLARMISALGRMGELDKMRDVYESAQLVLQSMENTKKWQSIGWFIVEDHMIVALAHGGDVNAAHVHKARIIEQGGAPTADAYGALIHHVKDTTDDTNNAIALFHEARQRGVVPNPFLYNTIISKLAKARKADDALALFHEMRSSGLRPSSVTYGAVIAACCRVGDVASAEALFAEMSSQPGFRARVPPYNTMMQLYTTTKPDRPRTLHYYNALLGAGIQPSAHTYKLLLDAYGSIEPVDAAGRDRVFNTVVLGSRPLVQGTHWASLIHSVGCVQKDLDGALALFDSITSHPSTRLASARLPDAVVFESLINVLAAHRRVDLMPVYVSQLQGLGIHMTAYIANVLIKAYASAGDLDHAREIFESLVDPPEGIAAPGNHAPHDGQATNASRVPADAPVYREPSTYEAMVRAELGHCNRDRAVALLERAQARKFPPAVLNRISGILLDDSVSPWAGPEQEVSSP